MNASRHVGSCHECGGWVDDRALAIILVLYRWRRSAGLIASTLNEISLPTHACSGGRWNTSRVTRILKREGVWRPWV